MSNEKFDFTCPYCSKKLHTSKPNFRYHISVHYNPTKAHCHEWYKDYFEATIGAPTSYCKICGDEFTHQRHIGQNAAFQYEAHLINKHGIVKGTLPKLNSAGMIISE